MRKLYKGINAKHWATTLQSFGWPPTVAKRMAEALTGEKTLPRWNEFMQCYQIDWNNQQDAINHREAG